MQSLVHMKRSRLPALRSHWRRWLTPSLLFLTALPVYAQSTGSDPWDNAVNVLKTAFTGSIAQGLSLVAIVVGGLMFAYGEGQSKKTLAGIVFGVGMAIGAVKFTSRNFTLADLIRVEMLTEEQAVMLTEAVREGQNILIAGGTGSGKSTLLGVVADAIPEHERILLIEDTAELHIRKPHIVSTESQLDTHRSNITFDDLLKAVLRHRPDRIIVGEVRGPEARTLLDAMNTGHRGTLATIHASSADESVRRLASLAIRSSANLQLSVAEEDVMRCIDLIVYISRHHGKRRVEEIIRLQRSM
jgi:Flp pilus assembly CpaF family ATPase